MIRTLQNISDDMDKVSARIGHAVTAKNWEARCLAAVEYQALTREWQTVWRDMEKVTV